MNRQFTESDLQQFYEAEKGLRQTGLDVDHESSGHNGKLIVDYLQSNPNVPVTVANIYAFVESRKNDFIWRSAPQQEYDKIAAENPTAAAQLTNWLATQGKVGQLVNSGDQAFENASSLISELRGRSITIDTISQAIGRLTCRVGSKLHFVPKPRKSVDPSYRPGVFIDPADANISPAEHARRARAAYEEKRESPAVIAEREQAAAKSEAEGLRGWSHSENEQLERMFITDERTREINWAATRDARLRLQKTFENRRATSSRIV